MTTGLHRAGALRCPHTLTLRPCRLCGGAGENPHACHAAYVHPSEHARSEHVRPLLQSVQSDRIQAALGLRHGSGRSGSAPAMPTLEELTHEIIEQRTLPADETYVAQARSTLGIICKHTVEPLIQDRAHQLPAPVCPVPSPHTAAQENSEVLPAPVVYFSVAAI